jgi:hypothetical protein
MLLLPNLWHNHSADVHLLLSEIQVPSCWVLAMGICFIPTVIIESPPVPVDEISSVSLDVPSVDDEPAEASPKGYLTP